MAQLPGTQAALDRSGPVQTPLRLALSLCWPCRGGCSCLCGSRGARCSSVEQSPCPRHPPAPQLLDEDAGDQMPRAGQRAARRLRTHSSVLTAGRPCPLHCCHCRHTCGRPPPGLTPTWPPRTALTCPGSSWREPGRTSCATPRGTWGERRTCRPAQPSPLGGLP